MGIILLFIHTLRAPRRRHQFKPVIMMFETVTDDRSWHAAPLL
ncbi:MAG: hypothetical protein AAFP13_00260 [Pseudomonadota bacterium]